METLSLLDKYCAGNPALLRLLGQHCGSVARLALAAADRHPELNIDRDFVWQAAMLHDIGVVRCDAPAIFCHGTAPYIRHGVEGAAILRAEGLPRHARVCERHTGAGLTADEITRQQLPLPAQDFLPETPEEQLVCYADKFFSKTHPDRQKTYAEAVRSLSKFGDDGLRRFAQWHAMFG